MLYVCCLQAHTLPCRISADDDGNKYSKSEKVPSSMQKDCQNICHQDHFCMNVSTETPLKPQGEQIEMAMRDVTNGVLGVRRVALEYQIPGSGFSDHVTGKVYLVLLNIYVKRKKRACQVDSWVCRDRLCKKCSRDKSCCWSLA